MKLRVHPAATDELRSAAQWYEDRRSGLGDELIDEADRQVRLLVEFPRGGQRLEASPRLGPFRHATMSRFPFSVVYRFEGDTIASLAFAHHSRRKGYWRARRTGDTVSRRHASGTA